MTASARRISPLRQHMLGDMRMRKFGEKIQLDYVRAVRNFTKYLGSLGKPDTGTLRLGAANAYTGGTTLSDGTLVVSSENSEMGRSPGCVEAPSVTPTSDVPIPPPNDYWPGSKARSAIHLPFPNPLPPFVGFLYKRQFGRMQLHDSMIWFNWA
jgi:autotransporter-associated beta strand protein